MYATMLERLYSPSHYATGSPGTCFNAGDLFGSSSGLTRCDLACSERVFVAWKLLDYW